MIDPSIERALGVIQGNWKVGRQVPAGLVMASGILALAFLFDAMPVLATQTPTEAIGSTSTEGEWLVHDVIVDGISLINNYGGQFTKILRSSSYAEFVEMLRKKTEGGVTVHAE